MAKQRFSNGDVDIMKTMYNEGFSTVYIGKQFETSRQNINYHLKKHGVILRKKLDYSIPEITSKEVAAFRKFLREQRKLRKNEANKKRR